MLAIQLGMPLRIDDIDIDAELLYHLTTKTFLCTLRTNSTVTQPTLMQGSIGLTRLYQTRP